MTNKIDIDNIEAWAREYISHGLGSVREMDCFTTVELIERVRAAEGYAKSLNELLEARDSELSKTEAKRDELEVQLLERGENWKQTANKAEAELAQLRAHTACIKCGGSGLTDSGGVHPWGESIDVPCDCTYPDPVVKVKLPEEHGTVFIGGVGVRVFDELSIIAAIRSAGAEVEE